MLVCVPFHVTLDFNIIWLCRHIISYRVFLPFFCNPLNCIHFIYPYLLQLWLIFCCYVNAAIIYDDFWEKYCKIPLLEFFLRKNWWTKYLVTFLYNALRKTYSIYTVGYNYSGVPVMDIQTIRNFIVKCRMQFLTLFWQSLI